MRIWKRLNLCKTFWSGERSCLIVAKIWLRCDKVKYFSYHFLKSVWRFLFCLDENIFTLTFWNDEKKKMFDKKKIFYVCRNVEWFSQWYNSSATLFELFAEMLNDFHSDIILLQLVWIVCRDDRCYKHIILLQCYTLWLIVNKIRNLDVNFADVCEVKQLV